MTAPKVATPRAGRGRPEPHPVDPRTPRRQARPKPPPPKQQPKPPRQPKKNGLVEVGRADGLVFYRETERGAIARTAPELTPEGCALFRRLLPPARQEVAA